MLDFLWFTLLLNPVLSEDIATNTTTVSSTTITVSYTTTLQSIASLSLPSETSYLSTTSMSAIVSTGDWPTTTTDYIPTTTTDYIPTTTTDDIPTTTTDDNPTTTELDIEPTGTDTDIIDDTVTEDDLQPTSYVVPKHKQCTIPEIESFYPERSVIYFSPTYQDDIPISCGLQLCLRYSPNMVHKSDAFTPDGGDIDPETQPPENIGTSENTNIHNNGHVNDGDQIPGGGDDSPDGNPDGDVLPDDSGDLSPNDGKEEGADGSIAIDVVLIGECINNCTENQLIPNQKDFELLQKVLGLNSDKEAMSFYLTRSKCDGTSMKGIMEQRQIFFNANATINRVGVTPWNPTVNPNPSPDNSRAVDSRSPSNAVVSNISGNTDSNTNPKQGTDDISNIDAQNPVEPVSSSVGTNSNNVNPPMNMISVRPNGTSSISVSPIISSQTPSSTVSIGNPTVNTSTGSTPPSPTTQKPQGSASRNMHLEHAWCLSLFTLLLI